jgi:hypothetical protein
MIKAILVPATGNDTDTAVFSSALLVARTFAAHIDFLHVRVDAVTMAAAMAADGSGAVVITGLVERMEEEASQRETAARALFQRFCEREGLTVADDLPGQPGPSARWLCQIGDEPMWVAEYGRSVDLLVIGRSFENHMVLVDTIEAALLGSGRPVLIPPAAPPAALPETIVVAWKAAPEAARAVTRGDAPSRDREAGPDRDRSRRAGPVGRGRRAPDDFSSLAWPRRLGPAFAPRGGGCSGHIAGGGPRRRRAGRYGCLRPQPAARMGFRRLHTACIAQRRGAGPDDALKKSGSGSGGPMTDGLYPCHSRFEAMAAPSAIAPSFLKEMSGSSLP